MSDFLALCGSALGVAIVCAVVRRLSPECAALAGLCLGLFLLRGAINLMYPVILYVQQLFDAYDYGEYMLPALKALGIATVTHITAETCRDLGEGSAAAKAELCGKAAILLCGIPVVKQIFSCINSYLQ